jgi:hypothetical protein
MPIVVPRRAASSRWPTISRSKIDLTVEKGAIPFVRLFDIKVKGLTIEKS